MKTINAFKLMKTLQNIKKYIKRFFLKKNCIECGSKMKINNHFLGDYVFNCCSYSILYINESFERLYLFEKGKEFYYSIKSNGHVFQHHADVFFTGIIVHSYEFNIPEEKSYYYLNLYLKNRIFI